MTRAGGTITRPDCVRNSPDGSGVTVRVWAGGAGCTGVGAAGTTESGGTGWEGDFGGKRGVVFALGGEPVNGGAEGLGGCGVSLGAGVFEMLGIGLVTAVDQAGGVLETGAGTNWPELLIGNVVAPETLGRGVGVILPVAGRSGRGGRLMRSVSRLGAFGSLLSGVGVSAIIFPFYSYFGKCSMVKFAILTYL